MRWFIFLILVLFLAGCARTPPDLKQCSNHDECMLVRNNIEENRCCIWDAINAEQVGEYSQKVSTRMMCISACFLNSSEVEAACLDHTCTVIPVNDSE